MNNPIGQLSRQTVLILGAGNVGEACAHKLMQHGTKRIILHTLTENEADEVFARIKPHAKGKTEIVSSWGDVLLPKALADKRKVQIIESKKDRSKLLSYYFDPLTDEIIKSSFLYDLIVRTKPDIIVDSINTATVVGYADDPYTLPREIIKDAKSIDNALAKLLLSNPVAPIIRFTQVLKKIMDDTSLGSYIKVSTTGLGGMGINLAYTHGDLNERGMSSGILGKVAASGIMHQLFWALSHTPGCNVKVVVPAALIGWQYVGHGDFRSHGRSLRRVAVPEGQIIGALGRITAEKTSSLPDTIQIPYVDSGENNAYSLHEMMAITTLGQMEAVTREEVSEAVLESILGSTKYDILTTIDYATLKPSYAAAIQRHTIFDQLKILEEHSQYPSIATNNLGPTVSKHLFELFILLKMADDSLSKLASLTVKKLAVLIEKHFESDKSLIEYALALGLPIINSDGQLFILDNALVPADKASLPDISEENLEKYAAEGWIDLRRKAIANWLTKIKRLVVEVDDIHNRICAPVDRNWQDVARGDVGEILGYIYSMENGHRKKEL